MTRPSSAAGISRRGLLAGAGAGAFFMAAPTRAFVDSAAAAVDAATAVPNANPLLMTYPAPAANDRLLLEALPLGNGRLGALVTSAPTGELVNFTDASMWTGDINDRAGSNGFPYGSGDFGTFTQLGQIFVNVDGHALGSTTGYRRALDLSNGRVTTDYSVGGAAVHRESYISFVDDVYVQTITGPSMSGTVTLNGVHGSGAGFDAAFAERTSTGIDNTARLSGTISNGLAYGAAVTVSVNTGAVSIVNGAVRFTGATSITVIGSAGTNWVPQSSSAYKDASIDPLAVAINKINAAKAQGAAALLSRHLGDYRALYDTFSLSVGSTAASQKAKDTWTRLQQHSSGSADPEIEVTTLQFGRYLAITSSRSQLPANLQGLWLQGNQPPWMGDYHTDINLQMNYWLADRAGLGPCFNPLANYCISQLPGWTAMTAKHFQDTSNGYRNTSGRIAGWTVAISTNVWGGNGWDWGPAGNAWICQNLMDHFWHYRDANYLNSIYPVLKGAVQFWEARLVEIDDPDNPGTAVLVDDNDWSPEQGPRVRGITYGQELVYNLLGNFVFASQRLGVDAAYASTVTNLRNRLKMPRLNSSTGELQEWLDPSVTGEARHRHLSPLVGLFPGERINTSESALALLRGANTLLTNRGTDSFGWGVAWRSLCWARLLDGEKAYAAYRLAIRPSINWSNGLSANLFDQYSFGSSSAFQIDANFGLGAAMVEMLVGSRPGFVDLLPALPSAWPEGAITGAGTRAGISVNMTWTGGQATSATLKNVTPVTQTFTVRHRSWSQVLTVASGASVTVTPRASNATVAVKNAASGQALEIAGGATTTGTAVDAWPYSASTNQQWTLTSAGLGYYCLINVRSGLAADVSGGSTSTGAPLIQWTPSGSNNQMWRLQPVSGTSVRIVAANTGFVVAQVAGTSQVQMQVLDPNNQSQIWNITAA